LVFEKKSGNISAFIRKPEPLDEVDLVQKMSRIGETQTFAVDVASVQIFWSLTFNEPVNLVRRDPILTI
jgi:hypothetical protein